MSSIRDLSNHGKNGDYVFTSMVDTIDMYGGFVQGIKHSYSMEDDAILISNGMEGKWDKAGFVELWSKDKRHAEIYFEELLMVVKRHFQDVD